VPSPRLRVDPGSGRPSPDELAALRVELGVPSSFPPDVEAAAAIAARRTPSGEHADETSVELVTMDPPGSIDLDQAFHAARTDDGWRVRYAIADVGWFVRPGDALDLEARRRGVTLYSPDRRATLYPTSLSEGAASLLAGVDRPALLWDIDVAPSGEARSFDVRRALVRSREQLTYQQAQDRIDEGSAAEPLRLLAEIGAALQRAEIARGGVHLPTPEQEAVADGGRWSLRFRASLPVENWNAQVSLLTGRCAAALMLRAGTGVLRTLPPPATGAVESLRRSALALEVAWPANMAYAEWIRGLDVTDARHAALATLATRLLRGAGYVAFVDGAPTGDEARHAAIAAPYAHVTAPLRRLADRYANEVALAVCAGSAVRDDVLAALPQLPELMTDAGRRQSALERATLDLVEALVLSSRVGEEFDATVVEVARDRDRGVVQLVDPAVRAPVAGPRLALGARLTVRLEAADPVSRTVLFRAT